MMARELIAQTDCGCRVYQYWETVVTYNIEYCPQHYAAPDKLAACKLAFQYAKDYMPELHDDDGWKQHQELVDAIEAVFTKIQQGETSTVSTSRPYPE